METAVATLQSQCGVRLLSCVLSAMLLTSSSTAHAAALAALPDLNGTWVIADGFMDKQDGTSVAAPQRARTDNTNRPARQPEPKLTPKYAERAKHTQELTAKGLPVADFGAACLPQGLGAFWNGPYGFEILQTPAQINLFQEYNEQTRRVYIDGRGHPEDVDPSYNGHSIGRWEDGTLVIDTIGFNTKTLLRGGAEHSEAMHVTERIRLTAPDLIEVVQTIEDPEALVEPWVRTARLRRKPGMEIGEYVCAENNRNPVGEDGVTRAILKGESQ